MTSDFAKPTKLFDSDFLKSPLVVGAHIFIFVCAAKQLKKPFRFHLILH
jgi:hypothetical protein